MVRRVVLLKLIEKLITWTSLLPVYWVWILRELMIYIREQACKTGQMWKIVWWQIWIQRLLSLLPLLSRLAVINYPRAIQLKCLMAVWSPIPVITPMYMADGWWDYHGFRFFMAKVTLMAIMSFIMINKMVV